MRHQMVKTIWHLIRREISQEFTPHHHPVITQLIIFHVHLCTDANGFVPEKGTVTDLLFCALFMETRNCEKAEALTHVNASPAMYQTTAEGGVQGERRSHGLRPRRGSSTNGAHQRTCPRWPGPSATARLLDLNRRAAQRALQHDSLDLPAMRAGGNNATPGASRK